MSTTSFTNSQVLTEDINLNGRNVSKEWTFQNIQQLLKTTKEFLPENDILKYTTSICLLDWDRLKFGRFTANDCRDKLLEVTEMVRCHRTLSELLVDAEKFFHVPFVNDTTSRVVSTQNLQVTESIENPTATSNEMELSLTVKDIGGEITADEENLDDLFKEIPVPVQNISTQTDVNSAAHGIIGQGQFNVELETVLTKTNWSRVVVNCGEKVDTHLEIIEKTTTSEKRSLRSSSLKNKNAANQKSVKIVDSNKKSVKSVPKKKLAKIPEKKKSPSKVAATTSVKRPSFPYMHFFLEVRDKLKKKHPEMNCSQLGSLAGAEYRKLPLAKKEMYRLRYYEEKRLFLQATNKALVIGKRKGEAIDHVCKKKIENSSADNKNRGQIKKKSVNKKDFKVKNSSKAIALNEKELREKPREYWGFLVYANENLDKLIHTEKEEKMYVIYKAWQSLEEDDREGYIQKGLRLSYVNREKLEQTVKRKGNGHDITM